MYLVMVRLSLIYISFFREINVLNCNFEFHLQFALSLEKNIQLMEFFFVNFGREYNQEFNQEYNIRISQMLCCCYIELDNID